MIGPKLIGSEGIAMYGGRRRGHTSARHAVVFGGYQRFRSRWLEADLSDPCPRRLESVSVSGPSGLILLPIRQGGVEPTQRRRKACKANEREGRVVPPHCYRGA
jgi:hypothetical protein